MIFFTKRHKEKIRSLERSLKELEAELKEVRDAVEGNSAQAERTENILNNIQSIFPFSLGATVSRIDLRDDSGKATKKNPSFDASEIIGITVTPDNYLFLVEAYLKGTIYPTYYEAEDALRAMCQKSKNQTKE